MSKNTSDSIEKYIKELLAQVGMAELKRSEVADIFQVVPSQINYVIKTRFTESRGYIVESKRGGGGYIRIGRVAFSDHHEMIKDLQNSLGSSLSSQVLEDILLLLKEEKLIGPREMRLMLIAASDDILGENAPQVRADLLRQWLREIDRKGN